jgi:hypothetical protein
MPRSRAIVGSAVARMVESAFSMKSAVATTSGMTGNLIGVPNVAQEARKPGPGPLGFLRNTN